MRSLQIMYSLVNIFYIGKFPGFRFSLKCSVSLIILAGTTSPGFAQGKENVYAHLLTRISVNGSSTDTARLFYCRNTDDNKLTVYTIAEGVVSSASAYSISGSDNNLYLYNRSIDQHTTDSLKIAFNDAKRQVIINRHDSYTLFPAAYSQLKTDVQQHHKITAIMNLLGDAIGDYPVADALPLFTFHPCVSKQIRSASIVTQRSQADLTDKWTVTYKYNLVGQLQQVVANAGKDIRFTKAVRYSAQKVKGITTYLNIESRQIVSQKVSYPQNQPFITWTDNTYEPGKDRETKTWVKLINSGRKNLQSIEPSFKEVLSLVKPTRNGVGIKK